MLVLLIAAQPAFGQEARNSALGSQTQGGEFERAKATKDPQKKIEFLEAFLAANPNSDKKELVLQSLMEAYQQIGNLNQAIEFGKKTLEVNSRNLLALGFLTYTCSLMTVRGNQEGEDQRQLECDDWARWGLLALEDAPKREDIGIKGITRSKLLEILHFQLGLSAYRAKNYGLAQSHLQAAVDAAPASWRSVYPLALAYLDPPSPNCVLGLWYLARSANLGPTPQARKQVQEFGRKEYVKLHGEESGWTDLLKQAKSDVLPTSYEIKCTVSAEPHEPKP